MKYLNDKFFLLGWCWKTGKQWGWWCIGDKGKHVTLVLMLFLMFLLNFFRFFNFLPLFDIFVDKRLKISFLLLILNIAPFYKPKISCDKFHAVGNMFIITCDVVQNSCCLLWTLMAFVNQGRTSNWKRDFLMDCFYLNNILIQILRFAYFQYK